MKTKIVAAVAALTLGVSALATSPAQAHHRHRWGPAGFGFAAAAIIGAAIASDGYYYGCHWEPRYDRWGNYIRSVKVCD
jgi:hypothetical protein